MPILKKIPLVVALGSLNESELREALRPARGGGGMPRFQDFPTAQPAPGQIAPDFELRDPEGRTVSLSKLLETKPVVLEFGSFT